MPVVFTRGKGAGSWPTPTTERTTSLVDIIEERIGSKAFPTPRANDSEKRGSVSADPRNGLPGFVRKMPTPTASMSKGSSPGSLTRKNGASRENDRLDHFIRTKEVGSLNPDWVELLMGWPKGWTRSTPLIKSTLSHFSGDWEEGTPRTTKENNHRAHRLKAIGNGQVPQAFLLAWKILTED